MAATKTLKQEILRTLLSCPEGLSRDSLYTCGRLSAHSPAALLLALQDLVAEGYVVRRPGAEIGEPYALTSTGRLAAVALGPAGDYLPVTEEARATVREDRIQQYGHPLDFCTKVAAHWSVLFGVRVTAEQVPLAMVFFKASREAHRPKRDNRVDLAGYAEVLDMIHRERELRSVLNANIAVAA